MKRELVVRLFLVLTILIISSGLVVAPNHIFELDEGDDVDTTEKSGIGSDINEEEEIEKLIEEAEKFDEELGVDAGLTPDSFFYFLDGFIDSRPEKVAEMKEMAERCSQGDKSACDGFEISFKKYREHADIDEREVSPEEKEKAQKTSRAIRGVLIRDIAKNIDPTKKDEFVKEIVKKENNIDTAAEIASKINELCGKLVELGEFEKANKVCNLEEDDEDSPAWLKNKRNEWKGKMSEDAKKFFEVLTDCMKITEDGKKGNSGECKCNEMPDAQAVLCVDIAAAEDACNDGGDKSACDDSEFLIEEFMKGLPNDLKVAVERAMSKFEEEGFERRAPPECEKAGANTFEECMLIMAEQHLQYAPEPCRDPIRNAIKEGKVKGERDAREICEKIMFEENTPDGCKGLSPDECAEQYEDRGRGRGPGPGVVFQVCDNIQDSSARLACYDANAKGVGITGDYYREKQKFREEFRSKEFDYGEYRKEFNEKFDGDFRKDREKEYIDFAKERYKYSYERGEGKGRSNRGREQHQAKIDAFFNSEEFKNRDGKPWFCDGPPEKPCYLGESYNYPFEDNVDKRYYNKQPCPYGYYQQCSGSPETGACSCVEDNKQYQQTTCRAGEYFDSNQRRCVSQDYASQCGPGQRWDTATRLQTPQGSCVPNNCPYGVNPNTGQCAEQGISSGGGCSKSTSRSDCIATSGCAWNDGPSGYIGCYNAGYVDSKNTACNYNGKCDYGESSGSCPSDCGSYTGGGSCYNVKLQSSCVSPCVWYSDSSHLTRGESPHCDDTAHATSSVSGTTGSGICSGSPSFYCPTGTLQCINSAWGCSDGNSKSVYGGSGGSCRSGEHWVPEPSNPPNYGYCVPDSQTPSTTTSITQCPSGTYPEAGICKPIESTTTTTSPPPSGTSPPPSGTGSAISGRAIYENPFLKYYFEY